MYGSQVASVKSSRVRGGVCEELLVELLGLLLLFVLGLPLLLALLLLLLEPSRRWSVVSR